MGNAKEQSDEMILGRTITTFRQIPETEREAWRAYRQGLRADARAAYDRLWAHAFQHADAASNNPAMAPFDNVLLSMLIGLQKQLLKLEAKIVALEEKQDA